MLFSACGLVAVALIALLLLSLRRPASSAVAAEELPAEGSPQPTNGRRSSGQSRPSSPR